MLSSQRRAQNVAMKNAVEGAKAGFSRKLQVLHACGGPGLEFAARELASGLGRMLSEPLAIVPSEALHGARIDVTYGAALAPADTWSGKGYAIHPSREGVALSGNDERAVLDAVYRLMRELGARFPLGSPPLFPGTDRTRLSELRPIQVQPAFSRRC